MLFYKNGKPYYIRGDCSYFVGKTKDCFEIGKEKIKPVEIKLLKEK